jgi:hypothetical protein
MIFFIYLNRLMSLFTYFYHNYFWLISFRWQMSFHHWYLDLFQMILNSFVVHYCFPLSVYFQVVKELLYSTYLAFYFLVKTWTLIHQFGYLWSMKRCQILSIFDGFTIFLYIMKAKVIYYQHLVGYVKLNF